jgi:hypothetical protein
MDAVIELAIVGSVVPDGITQTPNIADPDPLLIAAFQADIAQALGHEKYVVSLVRTDADEALEPNVAIIGGLVVAPVAPVAPVTPVAPVLPVAPVGPVAPPRAGTPFWHV